VISPLETLLEILFSTFALRLDLAAAFIAGTVFLLLHKLPFTEFGRRFCTSLVIVWVLFATPVLADVIYPFRPLDRNWSCLGSYPGWVPSGILHHPPDAEKARLLAGE